MQEFKYLGLVFHRELCMRKMQEPWSRALLGGCMRASKISRMFGVERSVPARLRLFQSFAFATGMYGCQVRATRFAHMRRMFDSAVSVRQMATFRRLLGVARGCYRWAVLAELNAKPYHWYWVKALLRFHTAALSSNSILLREVMQADALLARDRHPTVSGQGDRSCDTCWSAELASAMESIAETAGDATLGQNWGNRVRQGLPLESAEAVMTTLLAAYDKLAWGECVDAVDSIRSEQPAADRKR